MESDTFSAENRVLKSIFLGFWDPSESKPYDVSLFRVAAGKEKLGYEAVENQKDQKFEVERIFYEPGYNHATGNFIADIVLVVLKTTIEFRSYITPICIPYGLSFDERVVPAGWKGEREIYHQFAIFLIHFLTYFLLLFFA